MKPARNIEKLVKSFEIETNSKADQSVLDELMKAQAASTGSRPGSVQPNARRMIMKSRMIKFSAVAAMLLPAAWFLTAAC